MSKMLPDQPSRSEVLMLCQIVQVKHDFLRIKTSCKLSWFTSATTSWRAPVSLRIGEGSCGIYVDLYHEAACRCVVRQMIKSFKSCMMQVWSSCSLIGIRVNPRTCNLSLVASYSMKNKTLKIKTREKRNYRAGQIPMRWSKAANVRLCRGSKNLMS